MSLPPVVGSKMVPQDVHVIIPKPMTMLPYIAKRPLQLQLRLFLKLNLLGWHLLIKVHNLIGVQFHYNASSVCCVVGSAPQVKSPSITIYPPFTFFDVPPRLRLLRWGDYPRLFGWAPCNHRGGRWGWGRLQEGEAGRSESGKTREQKQKSHRDLKTLCCQLWR